MILMSQKIPIGLFDLENILRCKCQKSHFNLISKISYDFRLKKTLRIYLMSSMSQKANEFDFMNIL